MSSYTDHLGRPLVAVTGIGMVTSLGVGKQDNWEALTSGRLAGAGLDVFEAEPPEGSPLLELDNVLLAPHAAGMDQAAEHLMGERCVANILAIVGGKDPGAGYVLNPEVLSP